MIDELECVVSVLLAIAFGHLAGAQNVSWAAFSGYMVMRSHVADSLLRGVLRIAGTGLGAGLALLITPRVAASAAGSAAALFVIGGACLYLALTRRHAYAWLFVGLTFEMILLDKLHHPARPLEQYARTRLVEVAAGTLACVLVSMVSTLTFRRRWPGERAAAPARLGWSPGAARHAGQAAVALAMLPFLGLAWPAPNLAQSAVTITAVMLAPLDAGGASGLWQITRRALLRIAGCAAGAAPAAGLLLLAHPLAPAAAAALLIAGTALGVMLGRHIENGQGSFAYASTQFVLVILVTLVPDSYARADITPALERLGGILIGFVLLEPVLVAWHLVAPVRRGGRDPTPVEPGGI
jgi:uncharacterized membrane protein YccC